MTKEFVAALLETRRIGDGWLCTSLGDLERLGVFVMRPASCRAFGDYGIMRFYWACKSALARPGEPFDNFAALDLAMRKGKVPDLHRLMTWQWMLDVVDWFDAHRRECTKCNDRARFFKETLDEDWLYFDGLEESFGEEV